MTENSNQTSKEFALSNLVILGRLGRGATSHVFKVKSIKSKKYYAMKVIEKCSNSLQKQDLQQELRINSLLNHENIVKFIDHLEDEENHYILTEFCEQGQTTKLLLTNPQDPDASQSNQKILKIIYEASCALNYMHNTVKIYHGDIKLANILMTKQKTKLCDFGFSKVIKDINNGFSIQDRENIKGTLMYLPPEAIKDKQIKFPQKSDIWGLGICLLTLLLKSQPYTFSTQKSLFSQITSHNWIRPKNISPKLLNLLQRMLDPNIHSRITAKQIIEHQIFNNNSTEEIQQIDKSQFNYTADSLNNCTYQSGQDKENARIDNNGERENRMILVDNLYVRQQIQGSKYGKQQKQVLKIVPKICTLGLSEQSHKIKSTTCITIRADRYLEIIIHKTKYYIDPKGNYLFLEFNNNNSNKVLQPKIKKYKYQDFIPVSSSQQSSNNNKIYHYYEYAYELIRLLKQKQGIIYENFKHGYFYWVKQTRDSQQGFMHCNKGIIFSAILQKNNAIVKITIQDKHNQDNKSDKIELIISENNYGLNEESINYLYEKVPKTKIVEYLEILKQCNLTYLNKCKKLNKQ